MYVKSQTFKPYEFIPTRCAFGKHDPENHFALAGNRNPHLAWGDVPEGTRSLAIVCYDPDVPSVADDVNQEGKTVPAELPRLNFFHWVLIDLPPDLREIKEGMHSLGVAPGGKQAETSPNGGIQGLNGYTDWFKGDEAMEGFYFGYDGPAPPWNDERVHAYHFTVFALDIEKLGLSGQFSGHKVMRALRSHVLASASIVGLYAINPDARNAHRETV